MHSHDWDHRHAADAPHDHAAQAWAAPELAGFVAGMSPLPGRSLDLGCGTGGDVVLLAAMGIDAIGLDSSGVAIERAQARAAAAGVTATWLQSDSRTLPLDDASVDLVTDRGHLHHVAMEDRDRYATEVARVLRPGGVLLVRDLAGGGHGHGHRHAFTRADAESLTEHADLSLRHVVRVDVPSQHGARAWNLFVFDRA